MFMYTKKTMNDLFLCFFKCLLITNKNKRRYKGELIAKTDRNNPLLIPRYCNLRRVNGFIITKTLRRYNPNKLMFRNIVRVSGLFLLSFIPLNRYLIYKFHFFVCIGSNQTCTFDSNWENVLYF